MASARLVAWAVLLAWQVAAARPHRDVDGDGFDDAVLGHRYLYRGSATGLVAVAKAPAPGTLGTLLVIGDINGDGHADIAVGDPGCPDTYLDLPACDVGHIDVYLGGAKGLASSAAQRLTAGAKNTHFGMRVAALGDINGDHFDDLAVMEQDRTRIYLGGKSGLVEASYTLPAASVFALGDVDHDGRADLLAVDSAAATVYYGGDPKRTTRLPLTQDATFLGSAGHGDFDGDGFDDVVVVEQPMSGANELVIYRGGAKGVATTTSTRIKHDHARAELGGGIASVGDLDGDGRDDLVVEASCSKFDARTSSCTAGTAYVYLGGAKGLAATPAVALSPARTNLAIPNYVLPLGDLDHDGHADFAYGAFVYRGGRGGVIDAKPRSL